MTSERLKDRFVIKHFDTSSDGVLNSQQATCESVADTVVGWIEAEVEEHILHLDKCDILRLFNERKTINKSDAESLEDLFNKSGIFTPRASVENDLRQVQALPVVVVRNSKGEILKLRRKETSGNNKLHEKIVIWAGGHVRKEDNIQNTPLKAGAVRELEEELRLRVEQSDLNLIGAVYANLNHGTAKHVAIVYEWIARTPEVQVALSAAEFFERHGNSLSGTFESPRKLALQVNSGELSEEWTSLIVKNLLSDTLNATNKDLFDKI